MRSCFAAALGASALVSILAACSSSQDGAPSSSGEPSPTETGGSAGQTNPGGAGSQATGTGGKGGLGGAGGNVGTTAGMSGSGGTNGARDAGGNVDARVTDAGSDVRPPPCGQDAWPTYGHDPQRTSASNGCISGPLSFVWSAAGLPGDVDHMIATNDAVYTSSKSAVLDKVSSAGLKQWERAVGKDFYTRQWNTLAFGKVLVEDDQLAFVDEAQPANQTKIVFDVDDWGENTADADRFYVNSDVNSPDGPGLYVGAYDKTGTALWKVDSHKQCDRVSELNGSIAVDGGKVFRGAIFVRPNGATPFSSGG